MFQAFGKYIIVEVESPKTLGGIALPDLKESINRGRVVSGEHVSKLVAFNKEKAVKLDENHYAVNIEEHVVAIITE